MLSSIKKRNMNKHRSILLTIERYYLIFQWSLGSLAIIIAMLYTLFSSKYLLFSVFIIELIAYLYVIYKQTNRFFKSNLAVYLPMIIYFITHLLGPIYALIIGIITIFKQERYTFAKTKR